ncbi:bacteriophage peptidoglycan hydrolase [Enterococcus faecalis 06-MB-DW-09]|nr:bacteriophage peptidoglycan hydrolase [Enterococcus faecalis 06-MB-DW-09]
MANIEASISWFTQRRGKVRYSMSARMGPNSYDCSSAVYFALRAGGLLANNKMGNTDTLFGDLERAGWRAVSTSSPIRGDVFIWGRRGASGGSAGHTGIFVNNRDIIHCNYGANGISVDNYANSRSWNGNPPHFIYRAPAGSTPAPAPTPPRVTYTAEERVAIDIYHELNPKGYSLASIAASIGNADYESGLRPDQQEIRGPGYGLWQWTSPNIAESGRAYVQRLMRQAGISGDYRTTKPQTQLMDWGMFNGQWIGVSEPRTVAGFKAGTNVSQLTTAFMRNFERPGVERLQARQVAAQKWFKFLSDYRVNLGSPELADLPGIEEERQTIRNVGEIDEMGIKEGKIFVKGWHFSSDMPRQDIIVYDATNDREVRKYENVSLKNREDVKEQYPEIDDIEKSGFELNFEVEPGQAVYLKGIRSGNGEVDELIFPHTLAFEPAENAEVDDFASGNRDFFFEIWDDGKLLKRGKKILNTLSWSNEMLYVPETVVVLPIEYLEYLNGRPEIKLFINNKVFHALILNPEVDNENGLVSIEVVHVIHEWTYRQLSTNLACKNRTINDIYSTYDFKYSGAWNMDFLQNVANHRIDYVYSRQDKLEGLNKTCQLTDDVFWRVGFNFGRRLELGTFGEKKQYTISRKPASKQNIQMITEPVINHDYESVKNIATVYGEKSDSGMSSMSLRDVYVDPGSQIPGFPVRVLRKGINNERGYNYMEFTKLASNNNVEYSVVDEESIKIEANTVIETSYSFNDLAPFAIDSETISDEDRSIASKAAYEAAVKRLKLSRRKYSFTFTVSELPADLNVGDKIRFLYDYHRLITSECGDYLKEIMIKDDWFYLTGIDYDFDENGTEINTVTLSKFLVIEREGD